MEKELENIDQEMPLEPTENDAAVEAVPNEPTSNEVSSEEISQEKVEEIKPDAEPIAVKAKASKPKAEEALPEKDSHKRILLGQVVSNKGDKTIIIKVVRQVAHPIYKKYYKKTNKFMAHDPRNECTIGDTVRVKECRPLSARKRWELIEVVEKAK